MLKVLIAEDDPVALHALESLIPRWGYETQSARDGLAAWDALHVEDPPRLAILDWMMPGLDGIDLCRKLRNEGREPYIYTLLLTAKNTKEDLLKGLEAGADDYVTKPFDPMELRARLRTGQRILNLQAELISMREALRIEATHDSLTKIWNRQAIFDILHKEIARAERKRFPLSLVIADVDHFKRVNDSYGHPAGDEALRTVAGRIVSSVRIYDSVGRYGGEEFLIVLPDCGVESAKLLTERVRELVGMKTIRTANGNIPVTLSLGAATDEHPAGDHVTMLIEAADAALYKAKENGRDRIEAVTLQEPIRPRDSAALSLA